MGKAELREREELFEGPGADLTASSVPDEDECSSVEVHRSIGSKRRAQAAGGFDADPQCVEELVGSSPQICRMRERIKRCADSMANALVVGESGTGKDLVARALHRLNSKVRGPLRVINCAAIPDSLWESELFGHERGAFTGAETSREGWLGMAEGGTLFLDEVGEIPFHLQAKLLRVIETREFTPVGGRTPRKVRVRLVFATNRNLVQACRQGAFRWDLFYRINVITVHLSSLREHPEDIPALVSHFLQRLEFPLPEEGGVTPAAMEVLKSYPWPGNVRELENFIERIVLLKPEGSITRQDVLDELADTSWSPMDAEIDADAGLAPTTGRTNGTGSAIGNETGTAPLREAVTQFEKDLIARALRCTGGNKNRAARILGINRTTLVEKLRRVGDPV